MKRMIIDNDNIIDDLINKKKYLTEEEQRKKRKEIEDLILNHQLNISSALILTKEESEVFRNFLRRDNNE